MARASSGVRVRRSPYFGSRSSRVIVALLQTPEKSGWPKALRGALYPLAMQAGSVWAAATPAAQAPIAIAASAPIRSRLFIVIALPCPPFPRAPEAGEAAPGAASSPWARASTTGLGVHPLGV